MPKRVLCKFFAQGACLKGENCEYSHDWKAPPNNICTFYQKGVCAYGSRCRYEHVKPSRLQSLDLSSSTHLSLAEALPSGSVTFGAGIGTAFSAEYSPSSGPFDLPSMPAWGGKSVYHNMLESDDFEDVGIVDPADRPICSFAAVGECPRGISCLHIHGDLCPTCGKNCLHPFRPQEREEHMQSCEKRQKHLEALKHSEEMECGVCLELILSKPTAAERKFGILSECDHPFCISCIRNWRGSAPLYGEDVYSTIRSCPVCRRLSYFVIPSVIWYSSKVEKQDIIDSYKAKLRSIDCKHFNFGNGNCPFGRSCFYKHAYSNGHLEEVVVRHLGAEDGNTVIAKNISNDSFRLSDFLNNLQIR